MVSGSFSSQSSGFVAEVSVIIKGASSSQSDGYGHQLLFSITKYPDCAHLDGVRVVNLCQVDPRLGLEILWVI